MAAFLPQCKYVKALELRCLEQMDLDQLIKKPKTDIFSKFLGVLNFVGSSWIFVLMCVITTDVSCRIFFNRPLQGTPEIVANSIVAIAFLQIPYVLMTNNHVRATLLLDKLPLKKQAAFHLVACVVGVALFSMVVVNGWEGFKTAVEVGEFEGEGALRIPTAPVRFIVLLGSFLMICEFARQIHTVSKVLFARKER